MSTPSRDAAPAQVVPHQVLYTFADFPEVVPVDCWCEHDGDHFGMYPFHDEVLRPLIDRLVRRFRSAQRRRRLRLFRRLTEKEYHP
jgi:hypothetical protein